MMMDDYDGQMILGDLGGLKLPDIWLTGEEIPRKTSPRKLVPTGDRTRARCVTGACATACPTAVDPFLRIKQVLLMKKSIFNKLIHENTLGEGSAS